MKTMRLQNLALVTLLCGVGCHQSEPSRPDAHSARLVINEVMISPLDDGDTDWVELFVTGDQQVSLGEHTLVDDNADHSPAVLPDVVLSPGEHYVIRASRDPLEGEDFQLTFQLGGSDSLTLRRDGQPLSSLSWQEQDVPHGGTYGLLPNGTGQPTALTPTPGAPNQAFDGLLPADCAEEDIFVSDRVLEMRLDLAPEDWQDLLDHPLDQTYYSATVSIDGHVAENVAMRTKGNSSLNNTARSGSIRFPLKVDMNRFVPGQTLCDERKVSLSPSFLDPTFMREKIAYNLFRDFGLPASRTSYVNLHINGDYMGLYVLIEEVDGDFVDEHFADDEGDLYKPEPPAGFLVHMGERAADYEGLELQTNEETSDASAFLRLVQTLDSGSQDEIAELIDVDQVLRYLAVSTALTNLDSYQGMGHNYLLYDELGTFRMIPWDLNEAFAVFSCGCDRDGLIHFLIDEPTCEPLHTKPLIARLFEDPGNVSLYHGYLQQFVDELFTVDAMYSRIDQLVALIRPYVEMDPTTTVTIETFDSSLDNDVLVEGVGPGGRAVIGLRSFVSERRQSIVDQLAGNRPSTNGGQGACDMRGPP